MTLHFKCGFSGPQKTRGNAKPAVASSVKTSANTTPALTDAYIAMQQTHRHLHKLCRLINPTWFLGFMIFNIVAKNPPHHDLIILWSAAIAGIWPSAPLVTRPPISLAPILWCIPWITFVIRDLQDNQLLADIKADSINNCLDYPFLRDLL